MSKILAGTAACALAMMLTLPGAANAAGRRADGLRTQDAAAMTDVSARRYYRHPRRHFVVRRGFWGPRFGYYRRDYAGYPDYRRYGYWGSPYSAYGSSPYYYSRPVFSIGFGFGPRWGWGWW